MRRALITGISGQDGSYLAELLLEKGYEVYGVLRRSSSPKLERIAHLLGDIELEPGDITDQASLERIIESTKPHEIYNLAAQSFVGTSFTTPLATADATALGALKLLEAVRATNQHPRIYQASSSEMFGNAVLTPQDEETPLKGASPYGVAKIFAHLCMRVYRESYKMYTACGIAFNHESERRGEEFVTRKITKAIAAIQLGDQEVLRLGNLYAHRDWSHAKDIMQGAWLMLQQEVPQDYVLASGDTRSVLEFVTRAFHHAGLDYHKHVITDPTLLRPNEVHTLCGNASKARRLLRWKPEVSFDALVERMVAHDLNTYQSRHSLA